MLPSIAKLAAEYNTSETTIKTAQTVLRATGRIRGRQGKGFYVTGYPSE